MTQVAIIIISLAIRIEMCEDMIPTCSTSAPLQIPLHTIPSLFGPSVVQKTSDVWELLFPAHIVTSLPFIPPEAVKRVLSRPCRRPPEPFIPSHLSADTTVGLQKRVMCHPPLSVLHCPLGQIRVHHRETIGKYCECSCMTRFCLNSVNLFKHFSSAVQVLFKSTPFSSEAGCSQMQPLTWDSNHLHLS